MSAVAVVSISKSPFASMSSVPLVIETVYVVPSDNTPVKPVIASLLNNCSSASTMPSLSSSISNASEIPSPSRSSSDLKSTSVALVSIFNNSVSGVSIPALASKSIVPSESVSL